MKVFGYAEQFGEQESSLLRLAEVSFNVSSSDDLKALAIFLMDCVEKMKAPDWEHEHLGESKFAINDSPDVIVFE